MEFAKSKFGRDTVLCSVVWREVEWKAAVVGIWRPFWGEEERLTQGEGGVETLAQCVCRQLGYTVQQLVNPGLERMVQNLPKNSAVLAGELASVSLLSQVCPASH